MKISKNYELQILVSNDIGNGCYGDVYDNVTECKKDHPTAPLLFGFCVVDSRTGLIPDGCKEWNKTIMDAIHDWNGRKR